MILLLTLSQMNLLNSVAMENNLDKRPIDIEEEEAVSDFKRAGCGCTLNHGIPCSDLFSATYLMHYRNHCSEMSRIELDLVILSAIACARARHTKTTKTIYMHKGKPICMKVFLHLHGISRSRMTNLQHHYDMYGLSPRTQANTKRFPKHAASL